MGKRLFDIEITVKTQLELDDQVIDVVDDEWRSQLYDLYTPEEIAEHIAYNLIANNARLSQLDGWADQPDSNADLKSINWDFEEVEEI
jgi:hypothetical protein